MFQESRACKIVLCKELVFLFVAVATSGTNRVMTSPDGITWTSRTAAEVNEWKGVTYGNDLFVAIAATGTNRVMTSPDGITWTSHTLVDPSLANSEWYEITYGGGLFVAVSGTIALGVGGGDNVMISLDGIDWVSRAGNNSDSYWKEVAYGNGMFVVVGSQSGSGSGYEIMTSGCIEV